MHKAAMLKCAAEHLFFWNSQFLIANSGKLVTIDSQTLWLSQPNH